MEPQVGCCQACMDSHISNSQMRKWPHGISHKRTLGRTKLCHLWPWCSNTALWRLGSSKLLSKDFGWYWLRLPTFQVQGLSSHHCNDLSKTAMISAIGLRCHTNAPTNWFCGRTLWMANSMQCFGWALRIMARIPSHLSSAIGKLVSQVKTRALPGMQFFDARRIVSTMLIDPLDGDDLESFVGELPPREKWELTAQSVDRTDAQLLREQHLQARAQNKSSAQMAAEIAQVHLLTTLLADRAELLSDLACARQGYMDNVKTRTSAKADRKGLKGRAGANLFFPAGTLLAPPPVQQEC